MLPRLATQAVEGAVAPLFRQRGSLPRQFRRGGLEDGVRQPARRLAPLPAEGRHAVRRRAPKPGRAFAPQAEPSAARAEPNRLWRQLRHVRRVRLPPLPGNACGLGGRCAAFQARNHLQGAGRRKGGAAAPQASAGAVAAARRREGERARCSPALRCCSASDARRTQPLSRRDAQHQRPRVAFACPDGLMLAAAHARAFVENCFGEYACERVRSLLYVVLVLVLYRECAWPWGRAYCKPMQ
mmetsp:Transcript_6090/g.19548  ORF Transcript_6090/g.19548 Transcript_6090/m.19548 type:complete len:241 (-) Transcript_6090:41-763(-)